MQLLKSPRSTFRGRPEATLYWESSAMPPTLLREGGTALCLHGFLLSWCRSQKRWQVVTKRCQNIKTQLLVTTFSSGFAHKQPLETLPFHMLKKCWDILKPKTKVRLLGILFAFYVEQTNEARQSILRRRRSGNVLISHAQKLLRCFKDMHTSSFFGKPICLPRETAPYWNVSCVGILKLNRFVLWEAHLPSTSYRSVWEEKHT